MEPDIFRSTERILVVLGGIMSIYFGYRLFLQVPSAKTGDGTFKFPKFGEIALTHVAPGVFFAFFGAAVLVMSLLSKVETTFSATGRSTAEFVQLAELLQGLPESVRPRAYQLLSEITQEPSKIDYWSREQAVDKTIRKGIDEID